MACSTMAVHSTVNRRVVGSNPATPAKNKVVIYFDSFFSNMFVNARKGYIFCL